MNREQRRAQARATARVRDVAADPTTAAAEMQALRSAARIADLVIHSLLKRMVGLGEAVTIPYTEWNAQPPREKMRATMDDDGNITVVVNVEAPASEAAERSEAATA